MYPVTKVICGLAICFLASVSCYANNEQNTTPQNLVEMNWYEAKTNYNKVISESAKAKANEVACEQKLDHCDQTIKISRYYQKALAAAKARLDAAESKLYEKITLEFNAKYADVRKD
ncbi:MAG: hypothetical protein KA474_09280 [Acinetobacter sp.]|nr:hypothetical protein [Acinetobacter sp.]